MIIIPRYVSEFMSKFRKNNFQIFVVGGAVRNLLLKQPINNWDFTTNATPDQILKLFPKGIYNNQYGTVIIPHKNTLFETTPFRKESDYKDHRHPEKISWAKTIEEDLSRRDFTINSIAFDGRKIIDPYNGQKHLKEKLIISVGNPDKRFQEDGLRLIRAIRIASQLGFLIEDKTYQSIKKNSRLILNISKERIRDELFRILSSNNPSEGILFLRNTSLLKYFLPELDKCFSIPQKSPKRHHIYDVGTHSVMALKHCPSKDVITRLATLLHDIGKVQTFKKDKETGLITFYNHEVVGAILAKRIAKRLRLSNKQKEKLVKLIRHHQFTVAEHQTDKAIRRFIRQVGKEYLQDMLDLRTGDRIGSGAKPTSWRYELFKRRIIKVQKEPFKITDLKIDGHDIMKVFNLKQGKKVGLILKQIFDEVVAKKLKNEKKDLLKRLKERKKPVE